MGSEFWVQSSGFWVQRFWVLGSEVQGSGFRGSALPLDTEAASLIEK
jgi:hypothetical protein